jgi:uncharacterized protein YidB (DUF937 family)
MMLPVTPSGTWNSRRGQALLVRLVVIANHRWIDGNDACATAPREHHEPGPSRRELPRYRDLSPGRAGSTPRARSRSAHESKQEENMGLLDVLTGMQNGPRGPSAGSPPAQGGMSPWMIALLGLLAYKAVKGGGLGNMLGGAGAPQQVPGGASAGGGLGDLLGGMFGGANRGGNYAPSGNSGGLGGLLGGLLAGGAAGSVLNGGLRNLIGDMQANGQGEAAQSWIGRGENQPLAPDDLARAVGIDDIEAVARETGMPRDQLLSELSQHLPEFVDRLTPEGRLPSETEASQWT